ncbi:MAG: transcription antitermination factor NusB [candidate division Zixibacteria bacterium]|nr:transcription antitermination factor NusB [candidate division Zixibacteria bacterium]
MGQRRKARELVIKALYCWEIRGSKPEEIYNDLLSKTELDPPSKLFSADLFKKTIQNQKEIDELIRENVQHWDFTRIAIVDKNILRMGICELIYMKDIPVKVSIDEAIELAKKYSSEDSGSFVNGVLDAIARKIEKFKG